MLNFEVYGTVDAYAKKIEAQSAVKKVTGVGAVVEEIKVKYDSWGECYR